MVGVRNIALRPLTTGRGGRRVARSSVGLPVMSGFTLWCRQSYVKGGRQNR